MPCCEDMILTSKGCKIWTAIYRLSLLVAKTEGPFTSCRQQKCIWRESSWSQRCAWFPWWWCLCCVLEGGRSPACSHWPPQRTALPSHHTYNASTRRHASVHSKRWFAPNEELCFHCNSELYFTLRSAAPLTLALFRDTQATQRS